MSLAAPPRPPLAPTDAPRNDAGPAGGPGRDAPRSEAVSDDLASVCLFLVTAAAAVGANRMFEGTRAVPYLVGAAAAAHGLAWLGRRVGVSTGLSSIGSVVASLLLTVWFVVPWSTTYGVPTGRTFGALAELAQAGRDAFASTVAPAPATAGFIAGCVIAIAFAAFLADWAAFRMRTAFEACVPPFALFVLASVLGAATGRAPATVAFLAAVGVFLLVQLANLESERANWFAGRSTGATGSLVGVGGAIVAAAAAFSLVVAPVLPGYDAKPIIPTKHDRSGPSNRETISPLVTIRSRLVNLGQQVVFTVQPTSASYWRLTSLDRFDGDVWSISSETYSETNGRLGPPGEDGGSTFGAPGSTVDASFTIAQLDSLWLPAPYRPVRVDGVEDVSYNANSGSLITAEATSNGLGYSIRSVKPDPTPAQLSAAPAGVPADLRRYLALPQVSSRVRELARRIVADAPTPYERALAIQNFFRDNFEYSLDVDPGHSTSVLEQFLFESRAGYCEQFAGSYGVLARLVGLPTRVAVGFRPGTANPDGSFTVRDADAHAWPEVWFPEAGWVDFEPTPTILSPTGSDHTGLPPGSTTSDTTEAPSPTSTTLEAPPIGPDGPDDTVPADSPGSTTGPGDENGLSSFARSIPLVGGVLGDSNSVLLALLVVLLAAALVVVAPPAGAVGAVVALKRRRRDRRRAAAASVEARVALAWEEAQDALDGAGLGRHSSETVDEYLARVGRSRPLTTVAGVEGAAAAPGERHALGRDPSGLAALGRLGATTALAAYAPPSGDPSPAERAETDRDDVLRALDRARTRWQRLATAADPRPLWAGRRGPTSTPGPAGEAGRGSVSTPPA